MISRNLDNNSESQSAHLQNENNNNPLSWLLQRLKKILYETPKLVPDGNRDKVNVGLLTVLLFLQFSHSIHVR